MFASRELLIHEYPGPRLAMNKNWMINLLSMINLMTTNNCVHFEFCGFQHQLNRKQSSNRLGNITPGNVVSECKRPWQVLNLSKHKTWACQSFWTKAWYHIFPWKYYFTILNSCSPKATKSVYHLNGLQIYYIRVSPLFYSEHFLGFCIFNTVPP